MDFEFLEVLFDRLNLGRINDVLMGAYHRFGPGRPPFNPCMHALYRLRSAVERVNSRLATLIGKITFKGLKAAVTQVSYAILAMRFIAQTAIKTGKPHKACMQKHVIEYCFLSASVLYDNE